jgi:hypothetical protein
MSTEPTRASETAAAVKSREVQRAMLAEMAGDPAAAARHFLAAAHLELVLAEDYAAAGFPDLAVRSRLSAASCFWRAGETARGESVFAAVERADPAQAAEVQRLRADLSQHHPAQAS